MAVAVVAAAAAAAAAAPGGGCPWSDSLPVVIGLVVCNLERFITCGDRFGGL